MLTISDYMIAIAPLALIGISAGSALLNSALQRGANQSAADTNYQHQMQMMQYMNTYNSPAQQMLRFKEAGLNPNLIYSQGNPGNMSSAPEYNRQPEQYNLPNIMSMVGQYQNMVTQQAQADNLKAMAEYNRQRAITEGIEGMRKNKEFNYDFNTFNYGMDPLSVIRDGNKQGFSNYEIRRMLQDRNIYSQVGLSDYELQYLRKAQYDNILSMINERNTLMPLRGHLMSSQANAAQTSADLRQKELQFIDNVPKELQFIVKMIPGLFGLFK